MQTLLGHRSFAFVRVLVLKVTVDVSQLLKTADSKDLLGFCLAVKGAALELFGVFNFDDFFGLCFDLTRRHKASRLFGGFLGRSLSGLLVSG